MTPQFDTNSIARYEFANGCKPKGTARWIFEATYFDAKYRTTETKMHTTSRTNFSAAKIEAKAFFKKTAPSATQYCEYSVCS